MDGVGACRRSSAVPVCFDAMWHDVPHATEVAQAHRGTHPTTGVEPGGHRHPGCSRSGDVGRRRTRPPVEIPTHTGGLGGSRPPPITLEARPRPARSPIPMTTDPWEPAIPTGLPAHIGLVAMRRRELNHHHHRSVTRNVQWQTSLGGPDHGK